MLITVLSPPPARHGAGLGGKKHQLFGHAKGALPTALPPAQCRRRACGRRPGIGGFGQAQVGLHHAQHGNNAE